MPLVLWAVHSISCTVRTMADFRLKGLGHSARSHRAGALPLLFALVVLTGEIVLPSSIVVAAEDQVFQCKTEEDLDGSACRVDMLPDSALAEMVYER